MECPECGSKAIVAEKNEKRYNQGEPLTEFRTYVCTNWSCLEGFVYRNSYMRDTERLDTARWLRSYERKKQDQASGQNEIEFEED